VSGAVPARRADRARRAVRWIVFDVGETLVDETRMWHEWADLLHVPRFSFAAALGAVIARGEDHRRVFDVAAPGVDWRGALRARPDLPRPSRLEEGDLYPDVRPGLAALHEAGFRLGIAGNQPAAMERALAALGLPIDLVGGSDLYGVSKPDTRFFDCLVEATGGPAAEIAYVGDRVENDIEPAERVGLFGILLRRGPWATISTASRRPDDATPVVDSIGGLLDVLVAADAPTRGLAGHPPPVDG
jgi:FMN phosphatase YigB (HAD superfamily)